MVTCPRCEQPVDETVRTTCPLCFTPIQPQAAAPPPPTAPGVNAPGPGGVPQIPQIPQIPQSQPGLGVPLDASPTQSGGIPGVYPQPAAPTAPNYPASQPLMNPGARVSLTGEVIDPGMPSGPPPNYVGGSAIPQPSRPGGPNGPASPRPAVEAARRRIAEAPAKSGGGAVGIVVVVLLLLGVGFGGWYFWMHRTNPKDQAQTLLKALTAPDFKTAYPLLALSEADQKKWPDANAFASQIDNPMMKQSIDSSKSSPPEITVGEPVITGDRADVPTTIKQTNFPITLKGTAHMINQGGTWKLDATGGFEKAVFELFGLKDLLGGFGGGGLGVPPGK